MRQQEFAERWVEREAVRALAGRVDQHRTGSVDDVSCRDLTSARLQHVFHLATTAAGDLPYHREDRPDRNVDVDVGRSVERIEKQAVLATAEVGRNVDDPRLLLRSQGAQPAAMIDCLDDDLVGQNIQLLLRLALDVLQVR